MKKAFSFLLTLCMGLALAAQAQTLEYYGGLSPRNEGYRRFLAEHPDVTLVQEENYYDTSGELLGAFLTKTFSSDILNTHSAQHNQRQLMKKGYLLDLSQSSVIQDALSRMHPTIAKQAMLDGAVYAVPNGISFDYMQIDEEGWKQAGLTEDEIPDSFTAMLDFLDRWCDRVEISGEQNIRVLLSLDMDIYDQTTYAYWLSEKLVDSYIMQKQYAAQPLTFDEPELAVLLERCKATGARIYDIEPPITGSRPQGSYYSLFESGLQMAWPQKTAHLLSFRMNDSQPKLMTGMLFMYSINAGTSQPDLCVELLESLVTGPEDPLLRDPALLYRDAEAMLNPNWEDELNHWTTRVDSFREQLANPDLPQDQKLEVEEQLKSSEYYLEFTLTDEQKYYMSSSQLEEYKQYAKGLYFPGPGVFASSSDSFRLLDKLEKQYAADLLSTDQFINELARIARIIELENE